MECNLPQMQERGKMRETVLYYAPENTAHVGLLKGVLVQMRIRIRNLTPGRCEKKIGILAGLEGFEDSPVQETGSQQAFSVPIQEELLVLSGFTDERLDELLERLKKAGVPRIGLKAVVTKTNAQWTVYELYSHLLQERRQMEQR